MKKILIILSVLLFSWSCEKTEEYSEIPYIEYKDFFFDIESSSGFVNQVGYLTFELIDGNSDIGFLENEIEEDSIIIPDMFVYRYKKNNGIFVIEDTLEYLLPYFTEGVYHKYIKGEMEIKIYFLNQEKDTVKFEFQIMDRAYHLSNLESTPEFIVPEWN